jgi:hypothetical protein
MENIYPDIDTITIGNTTYNMDDWIHLIGIFISDGYCDINANIPVSEIQTGNFLDCKNNKIKLWLLNTLKDGTPWHIKYDFEPYDTENMKLDKVNKIKIIANLRILKRTKTSVIKEENLLDMDKLIEKIYNKHKNNSILDFFSELMENKDNCSYIENIQDKIIEKLLLFDMTGTSYYINLEKYS